VFQVERVSGLLGRKQEHPLISYGNHENNTPWFLVETISFFKNKTKNELVAKKR
jgi:hypothetical protein